MKNPFDPPMSDVRDVLAAAGLTDEVIRRVVLRGETERDSETPFDPPTRGGYDCLLRARPRPA